MRKLFWFTAPACAAVFAAVLVLPDGWLFPLSAACAGAGALARFLRGDRGRKVRLAAFGLCFGLLWTAGAWQRLVLPARELDGTEGAFSALVTDWPQTTSSGSRSVRARLTAEGTTLDATLYLSGEDLPDLHPGDTVTGTASFRLADRIQGEESLTWYAKGVWLTASAGADVEITPAETVPLTLRPAWWRKALVDALYDAFPAGTAPFAAALVTGDESGLADGIYADLQRVGLAHVVAVSGLHVSFLCGVVLRIFGKCRRRSALIAIGAMALFAAMTGAAPSVLRAAFMQSLLLTAPLLGREEDKPTSLALALFLLLLWNPYSAAGLGLQLSFASVAGIALVSGPLYRKWSPCFPRRRGWKNLPCRVGRWAAASLATTAGALVLTTPIAAPAFGVVSLASPLANLASLWAVELTFSGAMLTGATALWSPAVAGVLGAVFDLPGRFVLRCAEVLARLPLAAVALDGPFLWAWLAGVYLLLALGVVWRREGSRLILPVCAGVCTLCAALLCTALPLRQSGLTVTVLDVGQGQSVVLATPQSTVLVDCGGGSWTDPGDVAANYLQTRGRTRVDVLILTHFHADHAGGVAQLLRRMEVGLLIAPEVEEADREILALAEEAGTQALLLKENAALALDGAELMVYGPLGSGETNEEGLSVLGTRGSFDVLITGDMDQVTEGRLLKYGNLPDVELLVAGHHGSANATSQALLDAVRPEYAAISVGYNTYGHPAWETLARLEGAGCAVYTTREMGCLTFRID